MFFLRSPKRRRQPPHRRTLLGDPEIAKNDKIDKIHASKIQGHVFSEIAEAPQAITTSRTVLGDPETDKNVIV